MSGALWLLHDLQVSPKAKWGSVSDSQPAAKAESEGGNAAATSRYTTAAAAGGGGKADALVHRGTCSDGWLTSSKPGFAPALNRAGNICSSRMDRSSSSDDTGSDGDQHQQSEGSQQQQQCQQQEPQLATQQQAQPRRLVPPKPLQGCVLPAVGSLPKTTKPSGQNGMGLGRGRGAGGLGSGGGSARGRLRAGMGMGKGSAVTNRSGNDSSKLDWLMGTGSRAPAPAPAPPPAAFAANGGSLGGKNSTAAGAGVSRSSGMVPSSARTAGQGGKLGGGLAVKRVATGNGRSGNADTAAASAVTANGTTTSAAGSQDGSAQGATYADDPVGATASGVSAADPRPKQSAGRKRLGSGTDPRHEADSCRVTARAAAGTARERAKAVGSAEERAVARPPLEGLLADAKDALAAAFAAVEAPRQAEAAASVAAAQPSVIEGSLKAANPLQQHGADGIGRGSCGGGTSDNLNTHWFETKR